MYAVRIIESVPQKIVSAEELSRCASEVLEGKVVFEAAFSKMSMYHDIVLLCKVDGCTDYLLSVILCNTWSDTYLAHRITRSVMILFDESLSILHYTFSSVHYLRADNIADLGVI